MRIATTLAAFLALTAPAVADPAGDKAAVQAHIEAAYAVISGPVGQARDFDKMRSLFLPGAVLGTVGPGPEGKGRGVLFDVEGYIEQSGKALVENGFTEKATRTEIEIYGELAYAKSAYEGYSGETGEMIVSGVNYFTLFKVDGEWKIASLLWRAADETWPVEKAFE